MENIYGKNVAWFCMEGAVTLAECKQEGTFVLDDEFEVCGEDDSGNEGTANIDVIKLLESAFARIEELEAQPTVADYLASRKEMLDKTGAKMVTVKSLVDFMEKGNEKDSAN